MRSADAAGARPQTRAMPLDLRRDQHGFILARDARALGREAAFYEAIRTGELERIRQGVYSPRERPSLDESSAERDARRYLALVRASAYALERPVYTSYSAAALMGLPIVGSWPDSVYVMSRDRQGSRRRGVIAVARTHEPAVVRVGDLVATSIEFTLVQLCRHAPLGAALVATDAALLVRRGREAPPPRTTPARLAAEHDRLMPYPGSRRTEAVLPEGRDRGRDSARDGESPGDRGARLRSADAPARALASRILGVGHTSISIGRASGSPARPTDTASTSASAARHPPTRSSTRRIVRMRSAPSCAASPAGTGRTCGGASRSGRSSFGPACRSCGGARTSCDDARAVE